MFYSGFADEAGTGIEAQIRATKALGWNRIEARNIDGVNIHDLSDAAFERVAGKLEESGICEEAGVDYMHENCANYGGMSSEHSLRLLEEIDSPHFKLLFDTGNPLNSVDYREGHTDQMQNAFQFYSEVRE